MYFIFNSNIITIKITILLNFNFNFNDYLTAIFKPFNCYICQRMKLNFYKYQGTGNDFIMVDNRLFKLGKNDTKKIARWCNRRFGIGADGFILLENHPTLDFRMVYFNADGNESSMCGNGGRCITAFAKYLNIIDAEATFEAIDGVHKAKIDQQNNVQLQMQNVKAISIFENHVFLNTGSPHHVQLERDLKRLDVKQEGSKLRYSNLYDAKGCNINFVAKIADDKFAVRTYERGVEDETLSCGTGVTAVALAMHIKSQTNKNRVTLETQGGELQVSFEETTNGYKNIWLIGPTEQVFKGELQW